MTKTVDVEEKKRIIVENALKVFSSKGFHKTNMDDIAKSCGFGRTTLYDYFKNKQEIFIYVMESFFNELDERIKKSLKQQNLDSIQKIKALLYTITSRYIEFDKMSLVVFDIWAMVYRENPSILDLSKVRIHNYKALVSQYLKEGIDKGEIKKLNYESMGVTLLNLVDSIIFTMQITNKSEDINKYMEDIGLILESLRC